jgi:hypothetical protein
MQADIELVDAPLFDIDAEEARQRDWTKEQLEENKRKEIGGIARSISSLAVSVRKLTEMGFDQRSTMNPLAYEILMALAERKTLPMVYLLRHKNPTLVREMIKMPLAEQREIIEDAGVRILELPPTPDAEPIPVKKPFSKVTREDIEIAYNTATHQKKSEAEMIQTQVQKKRMSAPGMNPEKFDPQRRRKIVRYNTSKGWIEIPFADIETLNEIRWNRL